MQSSDFLVKDSWPMWKLFDFVGRLGVIGFLHGFPFPAGENSVSRYQKLLLSSSPFSPRRTFSYMYMKFYIAVSHSAMTVTFIYYISTIVVQCVRILL